MQIEEIGRLFVHQSAKCSFSRFHHLAADALQLARFNLGGPGASNGDAEFGFGGNLGSSLIR